MLVDCVECGVSVDLFAHAALDDPEGTHSLTASFTLMQRLLGPQTYRVPSDPPPGRPRTIVKGGYYGGRT